MNPLAISWTTDESTTETLPLLTVAIACPLDDGWLRKRFGESVTRAVLRTKFAGKVGDRFSFTRELNHGLQQVVLLGAGPDGTHASGLRRIGHEAVRTAVSLGVEAFTLDVRSALDVPTGSAATHIANLLGQGLELGTYAYDRFLSTEKRTPIRVASVRVLSNRTVSDEATTRGQVIARAIKKCRDLVNGPAQLVTPSFLAQTATEMAARWSDRGVTCTVLDREACEKLNMGCFLGVSLGSDVPPRFIHLAYEPSGQTRGRVCLIGKGVTFDSGGLSIKNNESMLDMKSDMAGAAAVLCALEAAVELGLPWEIHSLVAATENMINGKAYKLGDVLVASNGKTVEINNTDAEGRLTLADALVYGSKLEPDFMIDFATLTGACIVALGPRIGGVMTPDDALASAWMNAAEAAGEDMWRLPLPEHLKEMLKSSIADMRNTGERWGGALTAGLFLTEFTQGRRWMHVDIAGPALAGKAYEATTEGGTGFPVATIVQLLLA